MSTPTLKLGQPLSPTQVMILEHVCQGGRRKDFPRHIRPGTWGTQIHRLRVRLGAKTLTEAAVIYSLQQDARLRAR